MNKSKRPIYLNLAKIQLPVAGLASILHRVSGVIMFFSIGILLWLLNQSLMSETDFNTLQAHLQSHVLKFIVWGILTAFFYHLLGGIRHMVMEAGYWEELESGRLSAKGIIFLTGVFAVYLGVWLWQ